MTGESTVERRWWHIFTDFKVQVGIAFAIVSLGCAFAIWQVRGIADDTRENTAVNTQIIEAQAKEDKQDEAEARRNRNQLCTIFEQQHLDDVKGLRDTYKYLDSLTREEAGQTLNQFILRQLPETEETARTDGAPDFCDEPHVGLPEPDPVLPPRRDFSNLIQHAG